MSMIEFVVVFIAGLFAGYVAMLPSLWRQSDLTDRAIEVATTAVDKLEDHLHRHGHSAV